MNKYVPLLLLCGFGFFFSCAEKKLEGTPPVCSSQMRTSHDRELCRDEEGYLTLNCSLKPMNRKSKGVNGSNVQAIHHKCRDVDDGVNLSSFNWSGYTSFTGLPNLPIPSYNSVTKVQGTWQVPELVASEGGDTYSSAWVGIDGFSSPTVEQIGTEHDVIDGASVYLAWFEMYPADPQEIEGFPISPGDSIEGKVVYLGLDPSFNNVFRLTLKNHTKKVKFSIVQSTLPGFPAHLSSAEWIVEAPVVFISASCPAFLPLANFGAIPFTDCQATIAGKTGPIESPHWTYAALKMVTTENDGNVVKSVPSSLYSSKESSFSSSKKKNKKCKLDSFGVVWSSTGPFPYDNICPPG